LSFWKTVLSIMLPFLAAILILVSAALGFLYPSLAIFIALGIVQAIRFDRQQRDLEDKLPQERRDAALQRLIERWKGVED
jgi:uncharacterized membrane protein YqaE (UPF0057 family)